MNSIVEGNLDLRMFLSYADGIIENGSQNRNELNSDDSSDDAGQEGPLPFDDLVGDEKTQMFNFGAVDEERQWLQDTLLSDSDDSSEEDEHLSQSSRDEKRISLLLKQHCVLKRFQRKYQVKNESNKWLYFGAGVLTKEDFYSRAGKTKFSSEFSTKNDTALDMEKMNNGVRKREGDAGVRPRVSNKKRKLQQQKLNIEALTARRRKVWVTLCKKEIGKVQRGRSNFHKEMLTNCKRAAQLCMRVVRNKATQSQRNMKDTVWRMKRLTREMQAYWKKTDKVEREARKRMEKEAEEQRKQDIELMEAKRQQRKLNFLITQTELYAHFMQRKLSHKQVVEASAMNEILRQLDETAKLPKFDDYNSEAMKEKAKLNVTEALRLDEARAEAFPMVAPVIKLEYPEGKQPDMFRGVLKHYQLKGVSWLANLYDQGINGILADEMGLGKTVQAIAFLCHIAEKYSIWGPFLVISPASTLHNWQQEFARFVPKFKVIPYWGNPQERRILRQFWANKDVHTEDASFHVVITSYQLVVSDIKYFNKVKWQYLVLDEAQAIKSTASIRWKSLLGFQCRNRLLLSGTPVQNSMAELWALLHFIMPMLFDSHDEFAEWFSKDIENVAENKGSIDEKHLSRLHMILKPFMLRRVKKDVENELSDKIEIMVYCPLTSRQKLLYRALKKKIRIEDLLCTSNSTSQSNITSNLMNLVMQFRKVCNHPDLFERQEPKMPLQQHPLPYDVPKLLYCMPSYQRLNCNTPDRISNLFNIFVPENIHLGSQGVPTHSTFSFAKFLGQSAQDVSDVFQIGPRKIWELESERINRPKHQNVLNVQLVLLKRNLGETFADLVFTKCSGLRVHSFGKVVLHTMRETLEHRAIRSSKIQVKCEPGKISSPTKKQQPARVLLPEFEYIYRQPQVLRCQPLEVPEFLNCTVRKIDTTARRLYCYHRRSVNLLTEAERAADALLKHGVPDDDKQVSWGSRPDPTGYVGAKPIGGWFNIQIPNKQSLISDAGKLTVLDELLQKLKANGHRVLVYSQMTKMIDLLEEFMYYRKHTYMRLDGSSKISERRDMVADFQNREDIFVFLLSTRAGGLGINLTAADTVIFYDSDWNPTVDQQAMDRAHRLGQTKQVTVYRLICKGTIEERILTRAREKSEIQRMVISGGGVKPDSLKPTEVVSLLLDDDEIEQKYKQKQAERRRAEEVKVQPLPFIIKQEPVDIEEGGPSEGSSTIDDSEGMLTIDLDACPKNLPAKARSNSILKAVKGLAPKPRVPTGRSRGRPRSAGVTRAMSSSAEGQEGSSSYQSALERRGRGRPRLKPYGPANMGSRKRKKATDNAFEGEVTIDQLNPSIGCPLPAENISTIDLELDVNSWSFLKH